MRILIIIIFILFLYGAFSTLFHSTEMVGYLGSRFGNGNLELFGYLAYIDLFIFLFPLYKVYKNKDLLRNLDFYVGWIILFISLIILQSLLISFEYNGLIGTELRLFLYPYIGQAGLWLFWLLTFMIALVLVLDEIPTYNIIKKRFDTTKTFLLSYAKTLLSKVKNPFFDQKSTEVMEAVLSKYRRARQEQDAAIVKFKIPKKIMHRKKREIIINIKRLTTKQSKIIDENNILADRPIEDIEKIAPRESLKSVESKIRERVDTPTHK